MNEWMSVVWSESVSSMIFSKHTVTHSKSEMMHFVTVRHGILNWHSYFGWNICSKNKVCEKKIGTWFDTNNLFCCFIEFNQNKYNFETFDQYRTTNEDQCEKYILPPYVQTWCTHTARRISIQVAPPTTNHILLCLHRGRNGQYAYENVNRDWDTFCIQSISMSNSIQFIELDPLKTELIIEMVFLSTFQRLLSFLLQLDNN